MKKLILNGPSASNIMLQTLLLVPNCMIMGPGASLNFRGITGPAGTPANIVSDVLDVLEIKDNANVTITTNTPINDVVVENDGRLNITYNSVLPVSSNFSIAGEYVALHSDTGFDLNIAFNSDNQYHLNTTCTKLNSDDFAYLHSLYEATNSQFYANLFSPTILRGYDYGVLRALQSVDKQLIKDFINSNHQDAPEAFARSVWSHVRAIDMLFFEINAVAHIAAATTPEEFCLFEHMPSGMLPNIFGFLNSEDTGVVMEFAGADAEEYKE